MGYPPDLPEGHGGSDKILEQANNVNFNPPTSEDSDNDNNAESAYSGYEQLTFDGETYSGSALNHQDDDEEDEDVEDFADFSIPTYPSDFAEIDCAGGNSFPDVVPVDVEISQQVWNAQPAPDRSNTIPLDDSRTNEIINLMSGITLPRIPDWARNLPPQELLEKIKGNQRSDKDKDNK